MRTQWVVYAALAGLAACGSGSDIQELKKGQQDIIAKIDNIGKQIQQARPAAPAAAPAVDPNKVYEIPLADSPVRGPQKAKVTIVEFSDFQCPFCAQASSIVPEVLKAYPQDVNFVYKQFPLPATMHPNALPASKAAVAAGKQGKFWEMHDVLFQNQRELGFDNMKEYAGKIGLDVARWERDFNSPEVAQQIEKELAQGRDAGVQGTPTFFVAGKRVQNRSVDGFKQMVDEALKARG